ncbi:hypothetical protein [Haloterrigena salifodinae]|uniref:hypothetical protein n=1 Tax=Haloterrigena salifodinae TaxID=2675099 RepID=UPI000F85C4CC|nr:hypothetical protein [Haloterrigena salifodinae]
MIRRFAARFRDEIDRDDVATAAVFGAVLALSGNESTAIGVVVGLLVGVPVLTALIDAAGLDLEPGPAGVALGTLVVAAGASLLLDGGRWVGWGVVAIGAWILLDGVDKWRRRDSADAGDSTADEDDMSKADVFRYGEYNRWLLEELRAADRPLTADEIQSRTGLTEDDFERLLESHGESGPIERVGNGYALDENELGAVAFVRNLVRTVGGRLLRPFRLFRPAG